MNNSKRRLDILQKHLTSLPSNEKLAWEESTTSYSNGMFRPVTQEITNLICVIEGKIPPGLNGVYLRNGPNAKFPASPSDPFHYFDGDGMVASFNFGNGKDDNVFFSHKWVKTERTKSDAKMGKSIYDFGMMSMGKPVAHLEGVMNDHGERMGKANTALLFHHNKLYATEDADLPYPICPLTLETLGGRVRFRKTRSSDEDDDELRVFTAHSRVCPNNEELVGFGCEYSPAQKWIYVCASKEGFIKTQFAIDLPKTSYSHDFAASINYSCVFDCNLQLDWKIILDNVMGKKRMENEENDKESNGVWTYRRDIPGRIGYFPRHATSQEDVQWVNVEPYAVSHTAACFEDDEDGCLVIVTNNIGEESFSPKFPKETPLDPDANLHMYRINTANGIVRESVLWRGRSDFPTTNKSWKGSIRYVYAALLDYQEPNHCPHLYGMYKYDLKTKCMKKQIWSSSSSLPSPSSTSLRFGGEPLFVPRKDSIEEDDGYVLVLINDLFKQRTELRIYDARKFGEEDCLLATVIPQGNKRIQPLGTHGIFLNQQQLEAVEKCKEEK
jgi:carotenoid cleavage dioxygenase-like enzyme